MWGLGVLYRLLGLCLHTYSNKDNKAACYPSTNMQLCCLNWKRLKEKTWKCLSCHASQEVCNQIGISLHFFAGRGSNASSGSGNDQAVSATTLAKVYPLLSQAFRIRYPLDCGGDVEHLRFAGKIPSNTTRSGSPWFWTC